MTTNDPQDFEKTLLSLSPKPVPQGLRERVLESVSKKRRDLVMTPWMWAVAGACAALVAIAALGDAAVTRAQSDRLRALLNGRGVAPPSVEDPGPLLAEIYGEISGPEKSGLRRMALSRPAIRTVSLQDLFEARERLKGWLDHEDEGSESPL